MQKINIIGIISSHIRTLHSDGENKILTDDLLVFYVLPLLLGAACFVLDVRTKANVIELSVTVFSIFAALLLSVQVALYSVSLRRINPPGDPKKNKDFNVVNKSRKTLISNLNSNISYLILISVILITTLLIIYFIGRFSALESSFAIFMFFHFVMTLLVVVKRASVVFSREYEDS